MSAGSAGPAGVRNLRAMFENKSNQNDQSTSPPSRGRSSPNGSISSSTSRPVSKVRTSFVTVEKSGDPSQPPQLRLRKQSDVSSIAETREENMEEGRSSIGTQDSGVNVNGGLGAILKGSAFETIPEALSSKSETKPQSVSEAKSAKPVVPSVNGNASTSAIATKAKTTEPSKLEASQMNGTKSTKPTLPNVSTKSTVSKPKESPLSVKSPSTPKDSATNGHIRPRGGAAKIQGVIQSSNRAKEERAKMAQEEAEKEENKTVPKAIKPPSVATKPTAASKAHAQKQEPTPPGRSQLKSPISTRAFTRLPSAAIATTAASAARKGVNAEKEDLAPVAAEKKPTTITSQVPRVAHASTRASLARKSSRASLTNGDDTAKPRLSMPHRPADEGFLARLTRPTASSAQRAHEKIQTTSPPRPRKVSDAKKTRHSLAYTAPKARSDHSVEDSILEPVTETTERAHMNTTLVDEDGLATAEEQSTVRAPQQAAVLGGTA